ncbi:MAG: helix-turn-helix domain-containing protein [Leptolyngbyaceae cyanobacterium SM1_3_5]|nr:helix-turn-helix domain-containing protein [Leptolyngbyaceae cyanobacterium SM1_3_5]
MVGVSNIVIAESLDELTQQLQQAQAPRDKERLQVLYWLKQNNAPNVSTIAQSLGKHRNTIQTWLSLYRVGGVQAMLAVEKSPGGVRVIPQWAETALAKRLEQAEHGFISYGQVQQWLAQTLGAEAEYHAVYQMARYRLKAKLKAACPQNTKQDRQQRDSFEQTLPSTSRC